MGALMCRACCLFARTACCSLDGPNHVDVVLIRQSPTPHEHRYIGSFRVFIPWARLTSESVTVEIENVVLVASPGDPRQWDPEELRKKNLDAKRVLLEKATEAARAWSSHSRRKTQEQKAESAGYFARLATRIADNLFVFLKNVHIRYVCECIASNCESIGGCPCPLALLYLKRLPTRTQ